MRHIVADCPDVPEAPPPVDRRRAPDRRAVWRGGRRESDWINRPPGVLSKLESRRHQTGPFRRLLFSVLHLW